MSVDPNPYAADFEPAPQTPVHVRETDTKRITAKLVYKNYHQRILALRGALNSVIEWNATGIREFAAVDGERVVSSFSWGIRDLFEFAIIDEGTTFYARLVVRSFWNMFVRGIRLYVDDELVYSEGKWPEPADIRREPAESEQASAT